MTPYFLGKKRREKKEQQQRKIFLGVQEFIFSFNSIIIYTHTRIKKIKTEKECRFVCRLIDNLMLDYTATVMEIFFLCSLRYQFFFFSLKYRIIKNFIIITSPF